MIFLGQFYNISLSTKFILRVASSQCQGSLVQIVNILLCPLCDSAKLVYNYPIFTRNIQTTGLKHLKKDEEPQFQSISKYLDQRKERNKESFIEAVRMFTRKDKQRRGHIDFINAALKRLEEFGVEKDLEVYKELLHVFPKGTMVVRNALQRDFWHYGLHQECCINVLEEMEVHGVLPDKECQLLIVNIFGPGTSPHKKISRMLYWMPKFKNITPWPLPDVLPVDTKELARLALERISTPDPAYKITEWETKDLEDSVDDTWILSAIAPTQVELIRELPRDMPIKVEGPFAVYLREQRIAYFILRADAKPPLPEIRPQDKDDVRKIYLWMKGEGKSDMELIKKRSVHEQEDGIILGLCCTGTSSRDSLLSWIRFLEQFEPSLSGITVLFNQFSPLGDIVVAEDG